MAAAVKNFSVLAPSVILLVMAYLAIPHIAALSPPQHELALLSPYLLIAGGLILSFAFGRGRVFFVLLLLAGFYWLFRTYLQQGLSDFLPRVAFQFICLLIPFNITLLCHVRERGVLTVAGRLRLIFLIMQLAGVAWIIRYREDYAQVPLFFSRPFLPFPSIAVSPVPHAALLVAVIGFFLILYRVLVRRSPIDGGLLGALVAVVIACNTLQLDNYPLIFIAAAALILAVSVLQDSHNMAFRDDLTGLPSRRALNELMLALGRQYTIAMLDVDHFKNFNDTHGHDVGDQVLKMVAKKIGAVRGGGRPFRYGGEEFTIVFPRRKMAEVVPFLEEVRRAIAEYELSIRSKDRPKKAEEGKKRRRAGHGGDETVSVTISIGVAETNDSLRLADDVIKAADKALYRAKSKGRNQVSK
ncbi:diguanylate cyclase [Geotalea sp. SG265]|uniref:GGDEF domain-containing protein n=1 Tax=Geotalea sp. SG265 TaxID=2922867 RepID=UPI001FAECE7D|nr:diguanylate cyclase [Geotalea sp. SG265]